VKREEQQQWQVGEGALNTLAVSVKTEEGRRERGRESM